MTLRLDAILPPASVHRTRLANGLTVLARRDRTAPVVVTLAPVADNTLYESSTAAPAQQLSNGAGQNFYVGTTGQGANELRRGAIRFDLSSVPAGSTIRSATLALTMSRTALRSAEVAGRKVNRGSEAMASLNHFGVGRKLSV